MKLLIVSPFFPCRFLSLEVGKGHGVSVHLQITCASVECVVESAIFEFKFKHSEISGKEPKRDFSVKVRQKPVILESPSS